MTAYTLVMDDVLLQQWYAFNHRGEYDSLVVDALLRLYRPPHLTNTAQLERCNIDDAPLKMQLLQSGYTTQPVDKLAEETVFRFVLSAEQGMFPYANVLNGSLVSEYSYCIAPGESRGVVHDHLKALFVGAKFVVLHDQYIASNWNSTKRLFRLLPESALSLIFSYELDALQKSDLKHLCGAWKIKKNHRGTYEHYHDRYILIDNRIEVLITSGIDYLFDQSKECTVIIRDVKKI
jgi:hypothetical protein